MKLTKDQVAKLLPGQTLTIVCSDTPELQSVYEIAKRTRRECGVSPEDMAIACSGKTMTVVIRRIEKGGNK